MGDEVNLFVYQTLEPDFENGNILTPSLTTIPIEIFLKICTYLDLGFVKNTLRSVCKQFEIILSDDELWRIWFKKIVPRSRYPAVALGDGEEVSWEQECVYVSRLQSVWKYQQQAEHVVVSNVHNGSVDAVLLLQNGSVCLSGGRDRALSVCNVTDWWYSSTESSLLGRRHVKSTSLPKGAHDGWIWDLAAPSTDSNTVFSASWDSTVKVWNVEDLTCKQTIKCNLSVLCLACIDENIITAGLFTPEVSVIDIRVGNNPVHTHRVHKAPVLDIVFTKQDSHTIFTASEDKSIAMLDLRNGGVVCKKSVRPSGAKYFPLSLAANHEYCPNAIYAGDNMGNLYLYDARTLKKSSHTLLWEPEKGCKVNGLMVGPGALLTCSEGGTVLVMNPSLPLNRVAAFKTAATSVTGLYYENDVLVIGTCDSGVEVWLPRDRLSPFSL